MMAEPAQSHLPSDYVAFLRDYGPLWITTASAPGQAFSAHALVLIQVTGSDTPDGAGMKFTFLDPAQGVPVTLTFPQFVKQYEDIAVQENKQHPDPSIPAFPQVVHFIQRARVTEGYKVRGPHGIGQPVHETITFAGLKAAGLPIPAGVTPGSDLYVNEFLRGVVWNDDPAILLFRERLSTNWDMSQGVGWLLAFTLAGWGKTNDPTNLTGRSHFFDLQFVHGMAFEEGELPQVTLAKVLLWAEIMYRLSVGDGLTGAERLSDVPITSTVTDPAGVAHSAKLSQFFGPATKPRGDATLRYLLTQDSKFVTLDLGRRAIGSLLHLVQDSYALGHTRRTLLNPQDLVPGTKDQFKPGTWGRFGEVENFHCYRGQDHDLHAKYDEIDASTLDIDDLDTFNPLIGARDSVEMSGRLLALWRTQTRWDAADGPKDLLTNTIFKLSPNVTPADTTVKPDDPPV
jgi:hypothetical protein